MGDFNQSKYVNDFAKDNYDRIIVMVKKGDKAKIEEYRKKKGYKSLNQYMTELVRKDMNKSTDNNISVGDISQSGTNNSINIG